jgi:DNA polymerase III subunit epsilon
MRQIVLDTETTGLEWAQGHRLIEVACVELINRKFTGKRYQAYVNPERPIEEGALAIHNITNEFLQDKPIFSAVAKELIDFIQGAELIIHNAPFDVGFINHELSLTKQNWKPLEKYCQITDTLVLARKLHVGQRNSLDALCKRYSVDNSQREFHGALLDAHLLAQVYLAMTGGQGSLFDEIQQPEKIETVEEKQVVAAKKLKRPKNLIVLRASSEELTAHEQKLAQLQKKGKCLWQN